MGFGNELVLDRWMRRTRKRTRGSAVWLVDLLIRIPRTWTRTIARATDWIRAMTTTVGEHQLLLEDGELLLKPSDASSVAKRLEAGSIVTVFAAPNAFPGWVVAQASCGEVGFLRSGRLSPIP
jgi:hypothetical protein